MDYRGRTVLVTGASGGIGEAFARRLAPDGANLVLVARNGERLEQLAEELRGHGSTVDVLVADLSARQSGAQVAEAVADLGCTVDVVINNAGVGSHDRLVDGDPEALAAQIQLNVGTVVDLTARLLPAMLAQGSGGVLNVASTAAFQPVPSMAVYAATKAFVRSFTEALWFETRGTGVSVLTLCPGATQTAFFTRTGKEFLTHGRQTPDEVAALGLRELGRGRPTVVSGRLNRINARAVGFLPRRALIRLSSRVVAPA